MRVYLLFFIVLHFVAHQVLNKQCTIKLKLSPNFFLFFSFLLFLFFFSLFRKKNQCVQHPVKIAYHRATVAEIRYRTCPRNTRVYRDMCIAMSGARPDFLIVECDQLHPRPAWACESGITDARETPQYSRVDILQACEGTCTCLVLPNSHVQPAGCRSEEERARHYVECLIEKVPRSVTL